MRSVSHPGTQTRQHLTDIDQLNQVNLTLYLTMHAYRAIVLNN